MGTSEARLLEALLRSNLYSFVRKVFATVKQVSAVGPVGGFLITSLIFKAGRSTAEVHKRVMAFIFVISYLPKKHC